MAPAFVKGVTGTSGSANPVSAAFSGSTTAGNTIVAVTVNDSGTAGYTTGVTDSKGNTYTRAIASAVFGSAGTAIDVWIAPNIAGGASHTLTFAFSLSAASNISWCAQEFSGVATNPLDLAKAIVTGSSTAPASGSTSGASTVADEMVIGVFGHEGASATRTAGSGFSNLQAGGATGLWAVMESKVVAATGIQAANFTLSASRPWAASVITLKGPTAGGASPASAAFLGLLS